MPQKSRTPRPPKVQAPKTRPHGPKTRVGAPTARDRNTRYLLAGLGGIGVIALVIVLIVLATGGGGSDRPTRAEVAAAMKAAGFSFKTVTAAPAKHVTSLKAKVKYNTTPPSSGTHYAEPAVWDFYTDQPVPTILAVHNLEHGGIVIWWGEKTPEATIEQLRAFYNESPDAMLGTQLKGLGTKVALSAWVADKTGVHGEVAVGPRFDDKAFTTFRDAFRGLGPERFNVSDLKPGT